MELLDAFAILRQEAISFVTRVCLSVRTEQLRSIWTDFNWIWCLCIFPKISQRSSSIKIWQE